MTSHGIAPAQRPLRGDALDLLYGAEEESPVRKHPVHPSFVVHGLPAKGGGSNLPSLTCNVARRGIMIQDTFVCIDRRSTA